MCVNTWTVHPMVKALVVDLLVSNHRGYVAIAVLLPLDVLFPLEGQRCTKNYLKSYFYFILVLNCVQLKSIPIHFAGPAKPHTLLWCNTYLMAVQLTFELELRQTSYKKEQDGYSDLSGTFYQLSSRLLHWI